MSIILAGLGPIGIPELVILTFLVAVPVGFYKWGASIAESKGRPRALGWLAVFFGFLAILVLYLLPDESKFSGAVVPGQPKPRSTAEQLERLADLHEKGALTDSEYQRAKADALSRL